jgi:predicted component of type VI protein secretion system
LRTRDHTFYGCFIKTDDSRNQKTFQVIEHNEVEDVIYAVQILLNTRSPFSLTVCKNLSRRTVIDYGLPDFLHLSPLSRVASYELARAVKETLAAHEPRLFVASVEVQLPRPCRDVFRVMISGNVKTLSGSYEKVSFPIDVN